MKVQHIVLLPLLLSGCSNVRYQADPEHSSRIDIPTFRRVNTAIESCGGEGFTKVGVTATSGAVHAVRRSTFFLRPGRYSLLFTYERAYKENGKCSIEMPMWDHPPFPFADGIAVNLAPGRSYILVFEVAMQNSLPYNNRVEHRALHSTRKTLCVSLAAHAERWAQ